MLKKWIDISTKYQKEILIFLVFFVLVLLVASRKRKKKPNWLRPSYQITSPFQPPHRPNHNGVDYGGAKGSPILAIERGKVIEAKTGCIEAQLHCNRQRGNYVRIDHENGYKSVYLHLDTILVKEGQRVKRGQTIGTMGNTGYSTGTHLHLSITKNGQYIDPEKLFNGQIV
jgi:murein DD-endopeptidase MepM/ murein hydrolase activator NlpD